MAYSNDAGLYTHGLPAGSLAPSSRVLSAIDPATDTFTLPGMALAKNDPLRWENQGGALPTGLSASLVYYALPVADSDSLFQASLAPNGSPVDITDAGTGATSVVVSMGGRILTARAAADGEIDEAIRTGNDTPLAAPVPPIVEQWSSKLTAATLVVGLGMSNERWRDSSSAILMAAAWVRSELARYRANSISFKTTTPPSAEGGAAAFADDDRGWSVCGGFQ